MAKERSYSLGTDKDWDRWLNYFVDNPSPSKEDYKDAGYGHYDDKTGKYIVDHHDRDAYRRDQARKHTTDDYHRRNGHSHFGRKDILGGDYQTRHKHWDNKGLLADQTGREWEDHKYIDKVRTKTGRIRYIYELPEGVRVSYSENSYQQREAQGRGSDGVHSNYYREGRKDFGNRLKKNRDDFVESIKKKDVKRASKAITDSVSDIVSNHNYITDQIADAAKDTANNIGDKIYDATNDIGDLMKDGSEKVSEMLSTSLSKTPLKDLF